MNALSVFVKSRIFKSYKKKEQRKTGKKHRQEAPSPRTNGPDGNRTKTPSGSNAEYGPDEGPVSFRPDTDGPAPAWSVTGQSNAPETELAAAADGHARRSTENICRNDGPCKYLELCVLFCSGLSGRCRHSALVQNPHHSGRPHWPVQSKKNPVLRVGRGRSNVRRQLLPAEAL